MKTNFSLKFKLFDIIILSFVIVAIVASIITTNVIFGRAFSKKNNVEVYYQNELVREIKLDDLEGRVEVILTKKEFPNLLGDLKILIDEYDGICMDEVVCPNHTCVRQGWVKKVGYPITCLPNGVYVIITSPDPDQDIILGG